jgi:glycosyltransferase involved in cell wall biosynthesis
MTEVTDALDDKALRTVDGIQVENPWMFEYAQNINQGRQVDLRYAPPGVDGAIFFPKAVRQISADPYILCVARLSDPRKNIGMLLEAYALLPQNLISNVRLVLAGSSGPPMKFWHRVDELGLRERVTFIEKPPLQELVSIYQNASVFTLPSDEEGLGMVLLEAMACAIPVVATRCGGPDGIITDGVDGFLVPPSDHYAMSKCLANLLENADLNQNIGKNGFKNMARRYEQDIAGAQFVDMWEKALSNNAKTCYA